MTTRRAKLLLWFTAATAVAASALTVGLAVGLPLADSTGAASTAAPVPTAPANNVPSLPDLAKIWSMNLGNDQIPVAPSAPAPIADSPDVHLFGTVVERGQSMAMVAGPNGTILFLRLGDIFQGMKLLSINTSSATFDAGGRSITAMIEKPPAPAAPKPLPADAEDK
jgi:hypothetical protein